MDSATYSMTVIVTNVAPDFQTAPSISSNYQLHLMKSFQLPLPPLYDADGGLVVLYPSDSPGTGATALSLAHDPASNKLTVTSTQILDTGPMDPTTLFGTTTHNILMRIQDLCGSIKDYTFTVDVFNTAPKFTPVGFTISDVVMPMNSVVKIDLSPNIIDTEGHPI